MQQRWFVSILSVLLFSCAGSARVHETVARPRFAASGTARSERLARVRKVATPVEHKPATESPRAPKPARTRDAKSSELDDTSGVGAFAGIDTVAPKDEVTEQPQQAVDVDGIEGTMSEFDVRTTLESRDADFDLCHDRFHGGSGRLAFRIHVLSNGDVGSVKVHRSKVRSHELVECYTDVVSSTHFTAPHGGYADVKWTTKVGRSRHRQGETFEHRSQWDSSTADGQPSLARGRSAREDALPEESGKSRRERRHAHRHHHRKRADS